MAIHVARVAKRLVVAAMTLLVALSAPAPALAENVTGGGLSK